MKDEELDRLFRSTVERLDGAPPQASYWDMDSTFHKLQDSLNQQEQKRFPGIFDLAAAAVALLITFGTIINYLSEDKEGDLSLAQTYPIVEPEQASAVASVEKSNFNTFNVMVKPTNTQTSLPSLNQYESELQPKSIVELTSSKPIVDHAFNKVEYKFDGQTVLDHYPWKVTFKHPLQNRLNEEVYAENTSPNYTRHKSKMFSIGMPVGMSVMAKNIAPVAGVKVAFEKETSRNKVMTIASSINSYNLLAKNEENGNVSIHPKVFLEGSIGTVSKDHTKFISGHEFGVGTLLSRKDEYFGEKTIKMNYTISVKDKVHVSPELIVTEGFTKLYPGFKVTVI